MRHIIIRFFNRFFLTEEVIKGHRLEINRRIRHLMTESK